MDVSTLLGVTAHTRIVPLLAEEGLANGQIALLIIILGVSATMVITARRRRPRDANSPRAYAREQIAKLREEEGIKNDIGALLVEVQDISRKMNAQLDTKFCKLERVIRDADERIAGLDRLLRASEGRSVCDVTVGEADKEAADANSRRTSGGEKHRHAQVYQLADAGFSAVEIAEQTGQTTGEIKLILAVRRKSAAPSGG